MGPLPLIAAKHQSSGPENVLPQWRQKIANAENICLSLISLRIPQIHRIIPFPCFPCVLCAFIRPTDIRVHPWPLCDLFFLLSHTERTEITERIIPFLWFPCVPCAFIRPTDIRVHPWPLCDFFFLSHTERTELTERIIVPFLWFPCVLCAFLRTRFISSSDFLKDF